MPHTMRSLIAPLGRRLVARHARVTQATGAPLARAVIGRHRPAAFEQATRLAQGRTMVAR